MSEPTPATHIVVITHLDDPKVFLCARSLAFVLQDKLKTDLLARGNRARVYELKASPLHKDNTFNGLQLHEVGANDYRTAFEQHITEALYYANIAGLEKEGGLLTKACQMFLDRIRASKKLLETHLGPGVVSPVVSPNPIDENKTGGENTEVTEGNNTGK